MKKRFTRVLAMLLCVLTVAALLPAAALAADDVDEIGESVVVLSAGLKAAGEAKLQANATKKYTVQAGKKYTMSVTVSGNYRVKYQWQVKKAGSSKWTNVKKATKSAYTFKATKKMNKYRYRCRVKFVDFGVTRYSDVFLLKAKK